jgi:hypothetical protein
LILDNPFFSFIFLTSFSVLTFVCRFFFAWLCFDISSRYGRNTIFWPLIGFVFAIPGVIICYGWSRSRGTRLRPASGPRILWGRRTAAQPIDLDECKNVSDVSSPKAKSSAKWPLEARSNVLETYDQVNKLLKTLVIDYNHGKDNFSLQDIQAQFECSRIHAEIYIEELLDKQLINKIASSSSSENTYELNSSAKRVAISRGWI